MRGERPTGREAPTRNGPFMLPVKWGLCWARTHSHLPLKKWAGIWSSSGFLGRPVRRKKKKNASLEGLPVPRGPPPAASQMKIKRPTPWLALSKDGVAGVTADGRTANQQEVPGVVYRKFSKELHFLKSLNFLLSPMLPACRLMRNTIVFYPKPWMYDKNWIPDWPHGGAAIFPQWPLKVLHPKTPSDSKSIFENWQ